MHQLPLRPNVCMLVFNRENKLFLGERYGQPGIWQFPQGGVEEQFSLQENVFRELEEELGVNSANLEIVRKLESTHQYDFAEVPEYARGRWRGQTQTFWLVKFLGDDSCIALDLHSPEFMSWRWCSIEQVKELAEPKRLAGYQGPLSEYERYLLGRDHW